MLNERFQTINLLQDRGAKKQLAKSLKKLSQIVSSSYGPNGLHTIIQQDGAYNEAMQKVPPITTNDGITILNNYYPKDIYESLAKDILLDTASKINEEVGDGTTTSVMLAAELCSQITNIKTLNNIQIKEYLDKALEKALKKLSEYVNKVAEQEQLYNVAIVSSRNKDLADVVSSMVFEGGASMNISHGPSRDGKTTGTITPGVRLYSGLLSQGFVTDEENQVAKFNNPNILYTSKGLSNNDDISFLYNLLEKNNIEVLVVFTPSVADTLHSVFVSRITEYAQAINEGYKPTPVIFPVITPYYGDTIQANEIQHDLAAITSAKQHNHLNTALKLIDVDYFGKAKKITIDRNFTVIESPKIDKKAVAKRLNQLSVLDQDLNYINKFKYLNERRGILTAKFGTIQVGSETWFEQSSRVRLVEDAIGSTQSALRDGIIPGGGSVLVKLHNKLTPENEVEKVFFNTLLYPFNTLAKLSGVYGADSSLKAIIRDYFVWNDTLLSEEQIKFSIKSSKNSGYDFKNHKIIPNMINYGIIDPYKSVEGALKRAVSLAKTMVDTYQIIINRSGELQK